MLTLLCLLLLLLLPFILLHRVCERWQLGKKFCIVVDIGYVSVYNVVRQNAGSELYEHTHTHGPTREYGRKHWTKRKFVGIPCVSNEHRNNGELNKFVCIVYTWWLRPILCLLHAVSCKMFQFTCKYRTLQRSLAVKISNINWIQLTRTSTTCGHCIRFYFQSISFIPLPHRPASSSDPIIFVKISLVCSNLA